MRETILKKYLKGLKPAMNEKRWLAVFIETCALGLAAALELFQLHVHNFIPCLSSLPNEPPPDVLHLGYIRFVQGGLTF